MLKEPIFNLTKKFSFDAAHFLPDYKGKCRQLHGHTYFLEITVGGKVNARTGMIIDFVDLKRVVSREILDKIDHTQLNDIIANPTAENTAIWIWERLVGKLSSLKIDLCRIRLWETPTSYVTLVHPTCL